MPRRRKSEDPEHDIWKDENEPLEQFCDEEDAEMFEMCLYNSYLDAMSSEQEMCDDMPVEDIRKKKNDN